MDESNGFEKFPGSEVEKKMAVPLEQDFEKSFAEGVPEFAGRNEAGIPELGEMVEGAELAGDRYGVANPENQFYGEATDDGMEINDDNATTGVDRGTEVSEQYDAGIANAAAIINYGLNAAARNLGVETVVQKIKGFNAGGRADPIGDLYKELGIDTPAEYQDLREEGEAAKDEEATFREGVNAPSQNRSYEGAMQALDDMKELISEVEGADPRYEELREGARAAGKGYFEYAVSQFGTQGLTELFSVLATQRERAAEASEVVDDRAVDGETPEEEKLDSETEAELADGILDVSAEDKAIEKELGSSSLERETLNPEILKPEE